MKKIELYIVFIILGLSFSACQDKYIEVYMANSPVYMTYEDLRIAINQTEAKDLVNPGKMYFKDNYIFIIEEMKGIHIINNEDPASPVNLTFVEVPGAIDLAVKGTVLYTDSYIDLVSFDISDISNISEINRVQKVLPYTLPPANNDYPIAKIDEEQGVVIDWEVKKVKEEAETINYPRYWLGGMMEDALMSSSMLTSGSISSSGIGVGGSMARFAIYDDILYAVDEMTLRIFDVGDATAPDFNKELNVGWGIETIFIQDDKMFFGTNSGVLIYDISIPNSPRYISQFWHVTACDPVVVQDTLVYVTLRGGNACWNTSNELDVVSISDLENPYLVASYSMHGPYGLGIDDNVLFVCDGEAGLKIYDVTDPTAIDDNRLAIFPGIKGFDVIPINGILLLIGEDGLYQYSYDDITNIQLLSKIEILNP